MVLKSWISLGWSSKETSDIRYPKRLIITNDHCNCLTIIYIETSYLNTPIYNSMDCEFGKMVWTSH